MEQSAENGQKQPLEGTGPTPKDQKSVGNAEKSPKTRFMPKAALSGSTKAAFGVGGGYGRGAGAGAGSIGSGTGAGGKQQWSESAIKEGVCR